MQLFMLLLNIKILREGFSLKLWWMVRKFDEYVLSEYLVLLTLSGFYEVTRCSFASIIIVEVCEFLYCKNIEILKNCVNKS